MKAGFWHGVFAGFAGLIVLVQLTFAIEFSDLTAMYAEFGNIELPLLTRITLHPAWMWGAPLAGGALVGLLLWKKPRQLALYIGVAILVLGLAAMSYYYPRAPIYALAGNISAE